MNVRCASFPSIFSVLACLFLSSPISAGASDSQAVSNRRPYTIATDAFLLRERTAENPKGRGSLPPYSSRYWSIGEEAAQNVIHSVAQTSDGMIWVGTAGGLARFDTERFEFVAVGSKDVSQLKINALYAGTNGTLLIGTAGQGLVELRGGRWITHITPKMSDPNILSIFPMPDGEGSFVGTRKGILILQDGTLSPRDNSHDLVAGPEKAFETETVRSIVRDAMGVMWIGAGDNLMQMRGSAVVSATNLYRFNPTYIRSVCCSRDGSIWAGVNSGLIRWKDGKFDHYAKFNGLPDNIVTAVFEDSRNNLWVGTSAGLCRYVDGRFVVETTSGGESYDQIHCIYEDREMNLWVGAKNGLYQLRVQQFTTYTARHGLAHNNIASIYEEKDGTIWVGTWGGGLHALRPGSVSIYSSARIDAIRNDLVLAIASAADGGIWFCGDFDSALYRVQHGEVRQSGLEDRFPYLSARALLEDSKGQLLIGTAVRSVLRFHQGNADDFVKQEILPSKNIRCLLERQDGSIWIGTDNGLVCKDKESLSFYSTKEGLLDNFIHSLYEGKEGTLWIGTGRGLHRLHGGKISSYSKPEGLLEGSILAIVEDDARNLWLATRQGVLRVSEEDLDRLDAGKIQVVAAQSFGRSDGILSPVCVGIAKPAAIRSHDGRLWFATTKGLAVTDPGLQIGKNEIAPPVEICEILADKKVQHVSFSREDLVGGSVSIPRGQGELEIHYTALSYALPEKNRFRYRLKGFDADWVDAGTRRIAFYNRVPPGSYEFQVVACNNDGVWNDLGSVVKLTLQPHYWQTKFFKALMGLGLFGLVVGVARYATVKRVQRRMLQLEQQHAVEKERTRIARDMHDELGARLTEIRVLSDLTRKSKEQPDEVELKSKRISDAAGELIGNLHSIVWAVNPANDSLEKLSDFICGFAQPFLEGAGIRCRFDFENLPVWRLSSEVRHNIVLAIKEALNNAVKHSQASEVQISLGVNNGKLIVSIFDNGKGFESSQTSTLGNGLQNMEKRMRNIESSFQLLTGKGQGTTIHLEIPLKNAVAN